jgi:hypothetical protein
MSRRQAHRLALRNIFVDAICHRNNPFSVFINLDDELSRRLQTLGGMAGAW